MNSDDARVGRGWIKDCKGNLGMLLERYDQRHQMEQKRWNQMTQDRPQSCGREQKSET